MVKLKEVMSKKRVITSNTNTSIKTIVQTMTKNNIGCVILMKGESPIGIITERDIVQKVTLAESEILEEPAEKIMSHPLITISPTGSVIEAAQKMAENNIKKLPIVKDDRLVGIITHTDIIANFNKFVNTDMYGYMD